MNIKNRQKHQKNLYENKRSAWIQKSYMNLKTLHECKKPPSTKSSMNMKRLHENNFLEIHEYVP